VIRVYLDSNVFLYAIGAEHDYREPCRALVRAAGERRLRGETGVEALQEVVHHRRRRDDPHATDRAREILRICSAVHPLSAGDMRAALDLVDRHPELPTRDALHAATALTHGLTTVVSADTDFDTIGELRRIDPLDHAATVEILGLDD